MTASPRNLRSRLLPLALLSALAAALAACTATEVRDDMPGRAERILPAPRPAATPSVVFDPPATGASTNHRTWSQIQGNQIQGNQIQGSQLQGGQLPRRQAQADPARPDDDQTPRRRRGSSSPPPDPAVLPQAPRPVPLPPVPSTQSATDAFKRDLIRPEVDRMRTDDAMGRLDPLGQRDLMRRENDLRQLGDPLAR